MSLYTHRRYASYTMQCKVIQWIVFWLYGQRFQKNHSTKDGRDIIGWAIGQKQNKVSLGHFLYTYYAIQYMLVEKTTKISMKKFILMVLFPSRLKVCIILLFEKESCAAKMLNKGKYHVLSMAQDRSQVPQLLFCHHIQSITGFLNIVFIFVY